MLEKTMSDIYPQDGGAQSAGNAPLKTEAEKASEKIGDVVETAKGEAAHLVDAAKEKAAQKADQGKEAISGAHGDFADAIRTAGDQLGEKDQTLAARLVSQAAEGLETLSRTVSAKRPEDMLTSVRDFGRNNPTAFLAGAVLAGLALGRFARSSSEHEHADANQDRQAGSGSGVERQFAESEGFIAPEPPSFQAQAALSGEATPSGPEGMSVLGEDEADIGRAPMTGI